MKPPFQAPQLEPLSPPVKRVLLFLLLVALIITAADGSKFRGDERFYTDAVLEMMRTGDHWTPTYADGQIRLLKPIFTYWAVLVPFKIFGISFFASRFLFACAAAAMIWVTYRIARTIFRSELTACLAAIIAASNTEILTMGTRSTPDILLALSVVTSVWGFARIWFERNTGVISWLLALGGMGCAVQVKGLLGICPLGMLVLFRIFSREKAPPLRISAVLPGLSIGVALGLFWYVVMLNRHGFGAMGDFYSDQVGTRISKSIGFVLGNFAAYVFGAIRHSAAFCLVLTIAWKNASTSIREQLRKHRSTAIFLLSLFVLLVFCFCFGNIRRPRYLTASYPLLAIFVAWLLATALAQENVQRRVLRWIGCVFLFVIPIALIGAVAGLTIHWGLATALFLIAFVGFAGFYLVRLGKIIPSLAAVSALVVSAFLIGGLAVRTTVKPSPWPQIASLLQDSAIEPICLLGFSEAEAAQLRICLKGKTDIRSITTNDLPKLTNWSTILTSSDLRGSVTSDVVSSAPINLQDTPLTDSWIGRKMIKKKKTENSDPWILSHERH